MGRARGSITKLGIKDMFSWIKRQFADTCCTKWFRGTWNHCCCRHDDCYGDKIKSRKKCDNEFGICTANSSLFGLFLSPFMYGAVRIKGSRYYKGKSMKLKKLSKSFTFKSGAVGFGAITGAVAYREPITQILDGIFGDGTGATLFTFITSAIALFGLFGVGKGRLEAERNIPLGKR